MDLKPITEAPVDADMWCVPSTIATLTGCGYIMAAEACVRVGAAETFRGLSSVHVEHAILALREIVPDVKVYTVNLADRYPDLTAGPTLLRYLTERPWEEIAYKLIISTATHMIACHVDMLCDNHTKRPVYFKRFPKLKRSVVWAARVAF